MAICEICGNERAAGTAPCRFCGHKPSEEIGRNSRIFLEKTVNLELGRPVAEIAIAHMEQAIDDAKRTGITVLTFIHGYGSSGKGGIIRKECRKSLDYFKCKGRINDYIPGEDFHKRSKHVKMLLQRYPKLGNSTNLNRNNRGVTLVILS